MPGAQATLDEFFRLCDEAGPEGCAFADDSAAAVRRSRRPTEAGRRSRSSIPSPASRSLLRYSDLIGITLGALYDSIQLAGTRPGPVADRTTCIAGGDRRGDGSGGSEGGPGRRVASRTPLSELRRGIPRRLLLGQRQPRRLRLLVDCRRRIRRPVRLLRPDLDLGLLHLRLLARVRPGPLPRPVRP